MEKLDMQTKNLADEKFEALKALFPNAVTEAKNESGGVIRAIDKDILMQEIATEVVEGRDERYQFTWPNKREAILAANAPLSKTLRPAREESVNFDETENLYIEGDNLEVLKLLQETYLGKIKMIYIDPPYNTGSDFVYNDDFKQSMEDYIEESGQYDEEGNRLEKNLESNGRFHTDWLNMMYPRLKLARNLLSDDGVIFISIDDNEQANLKKVCDEVFGEGNFVAQIIWERAYAPINLKKHFSESHDYIICYAKHIDLAISNGLKRTNDADSRYKNPDNDPRGPWKSGDFSVGPAVEKNIYEIITPSGKKCLPPNGRSWAVSEEKFKEMKRNNEVWFGEDGDNVPSQKRFLKNVKQGITPMTIWKYKDVGHSQEATKRLKELFGGKKYFDYPKSVELIKRCVSLYSDEDSIILDFFSGSTTTAHAVMDLNAEDGGNRKYIMVQLPEETDEKSEAYKAGYNTICDIGKERIRRAGQKILEENKYKENIKDLDIGFRVLKTDSSNMKDVYYAPDMTEQGFLDSLENNIKEDRFPEDLLFQVMLDLGIPLSAGIQVETMGGKDVFVVEEGFLIACFDGHVGEDVVKAIAEKQPYYAVFRDASMAGDSVATNFDQIFESISPETARRVL